MFKNPQLPINIILSLTMVALLVPVARADKRPVKPLGEWTGSVADAELAKRRAELITDAKSLEKLWKKWQIKGKVPGVDFKNELVVLATTVGSRASLSISLDDKGNLQVIGVATRDSRPGFRYVIAAVNRKGVKTVNGKPLKEEAKDKP